jgi:hypothetical protein
LGATEKYPDPEFSHLPDVETTDGLLDLLSACILAILANVLDFRMYSAPNQGEHDKVTAMQKRLMILFDRNDISSNERLGICYARGVALMVFEWIRSYCVIKNHQGDVVDDLPSIYVVQILNALLAYKANAMHKKHVGAPHCNVALLTAQVDNVVKCDKAIEKLWTERQRFPSDTLAISLAGCSIEWKINPGIPARKLT